MISFRIEGRIASGKNQMMIDPRTGRHYPKKEFVAWRDDVFAQMKTQVGGLYYAPLAMPLRLECVYSAPDRRVRDVAGMLDALCHVLEKYPLVESDGLIQEVIWQRVDIFDKPGGKPIRPGLLVKLIPLA